MLAVAVLVVVVGGGFALQRGVGAARPRTAPAAHTSSGAWFCPHGGGPKAVEGDVVPGESGESAVAVRVTSISARKPGNPQDVTVPPQATVSVPVPAKGREASTYVEYFDGWIAASWVTQGGGGEVGVGAEPCAPATSPTWFAPDGTTEQGEDAYLVVMNPFAVDAVFDVVLLTPKREPIRNSELTDHVLRPGKSVAFRLNAFDEGDPAVGAEVDVSLGRVAVSSMGITRDGGIRDVIGSVETGPRAYLPVGGRCGTVDDRPHGARRRCRSTSARPCYPSAHRCRREGLTEASQNPTSASPYPVTFSGPVVGRCGRAGRRVVRRRTAKRGRRERRWRDRRGAGAGIRLGGASGDRGRARAAADRAGEPGEHVGDGHAPRAGVGGRHADRRRHLTIPAGTVGPGSSRVPRGVAPTPRSRSGRRVATSSPSPRRRRSE